MLITLDEAATRLGVGVKPLAKAALEHGFIIRVGASQRLMVSELGELIEKCRCHPKVPDSSFGKGGTDPTLGLSKILAGSNKARAQGIADKLKSNSRNTSAGRTGEVVPLKPMK